jgi:hypothetical protein
VVKGRRAADRRRERQGKGPDDGGPSDGLTTPGQAVDPLPSEPDSEMEDHDLPMVSQVREVEPSLDVPGTTPGKQGRSDFPQSNDAEASFVKAVRATVDQRGQVGDVTAVRSAPNKPRKMGAKIVVLEGPDEGGEADLDVIPSLIGRTATAEVGLTDPTISLRHLELRLATIGEGYALVDLGSTSGTLVNGVLVDGEVNLKHGDVIALGKTVMRFFRGSVEPKPRPEPEPPPIEPTEQLPDRSRATGVSRVGEKSSTRPATVRTQLPAKPPVDPAIVRARIRQTTTRVIGACALILVVALTGKLVWGRYIADSSPAQIRGQVAELLADGRNRLRAQDVDGAAASAETVLALDADNDEAHSLLKMASTEMEARDAVALALRLGDEERDVEAGQILKRIPDVSVFAPTRDRLKRTLDERGMLRSKRTIETLIDAGQTVEALAMAEKHVQLYPKDAEGPLILERVKGLQEQAPKNPGLSEARAAFANGDTSKAKSLARQNGFDGYAKDVEQFEASLAKGKGALSRFDGDAAESLNDAFRLLSQLGASASSPIFADVRRPYGKALLIAGNEKLDKADKGAKCAGARDIFRAGRVLGDAPEIQQRLRDVEAMALQGLERARAAKSQDADRAATIAREHVCFARAGTRTFEDLRALSRL